MRWFADFRFANHSVVVDSWTPRKHGLEQRDNLRFRNVKKAILQRILQELQVPVSFVEESTSISCKQKVLSTIYKQAF